MNVRTLEDVADGREVARVDARASTAASDDVLPGDALADVSDGYALAL